MIHIKADPLQPCKVPNARHLKIETGLAEIQCIDGFAKTFPILLQPIDQWLPGMKTFRRQNKIRRFHLDAKIKEDPQHGYFFIGCPVGGGSRSSKYNLHYPGGFQKVFPYLAAGPAAGKGNKVQLFFAEEVQFIDNGSAGLFNLFG